MTVRERKRERCYGRKEIKFEYNFFSEFNYKQLGLLVNLSYQTKEDEPK